MLRSRTTAVSLARRFGLGSATAVLDLRIGAVVWAASGGREHITVWAPADLLLSRVVQSESQ